MSMLRVGLFLTLFVTGSFAQSTYNHLDLFSVTPANVQPQGTPTLYASSVTRQIDYRGTDNVIYSFNTYNHGFSWTNLSSLGHAPGAAGDPAMGYTSTPQNVVAFRGFDNHIYRLAAQNGVWVTTDLTGSSNPLQALADPSLFASSVVQNVDYAAVGGLEQIYRYGTSGSWTIANLAPSLCGNAPSVSSALAITYTSLPENIVVYNGLYNSNGQKWDLFALTAKNGQWTCGFITGSLSGNGSVSPAPNSSPALYADANIILVPYTNGYQAFEVQSFVSGGNPIPVNLSTASGIGVVITMGNPSIAYSSSAHYVAVRALLGNQSYDDIIVFSNTGQGWHYECATCATNHYPYAASDVRIALYNGNPVIAYSGVDGHVHLLYKGPSPQ